MSYLVIRTDYLYEPSEDWPVASNPPDVERYRHLFVGVTMHQSWTAAADAVADDILEDYPEHTPGDELIIDRMERHGDIEIAGVRSRSVWRIKALNVNVSPYLIN